jgi:hypothetical protein
MCRLETFPLNLVVTAYSVRRQINIGQSVNTIYLFREGAVS